MAEPEDAGHRACEEFAREGVDLATFLLSLGTSVICHLGVAPNPETGKTDVNLPMARHVIDIIAMIQAKTQGNLTDDERKLVDTLLFDLRLKFVEACGQSGGPAGPA